MTHYELEQRYKEYGREDFKLRTLGDLKNIHGFDVAELSGYAELPPKQREIFDRTVIRFYNGQGLDRRNQLLPKCVHYVCEVEYTSDENELVGTDIFIIKSDGKSVGKRLHRYKYDKSTDLRKCRKCLTSTYLRFELKSEWYHFTPNSDWY